MLTDKKFLHLLMIEFVDHIDGLPHLVDKRVGGREVPFGDFREDTFRKRDSRRSTSSDFKYSWSSS